MLLISVRSVPLHHSSLVTDFCSISATALLQEKERLAEEEKLRKKFWAAKEHIGEPFEHYAQLEVSASLAAPGGAGLAAPGGAGLAAPGGAGLADLGGVCYTQKYAMSSCLH